VEVDGLQALLVLAFGKLLVLEAVLLVAESRAEEATLASNAVTEECT
jgi:hypothetical protein